MLSPHARQRIDRPASSSLTRAVCPHSPQFTTIDMAPSLLRSVCPRFLGFLRGEGRVRTWKYPNPPAVPIPALFVVAIDRLHQAGLSCQDTPNRSCTQANFLLKGYSDSGMSGTMELTVE
jgi:hypothetical protein